MLDIKTLEDWLWETVCKIRGEIDAPKYKDFILPMIFIKRLSDVFEDELLTLSEEYGTISSFMVEELLKENHALVRFYIPEKDRWKHISQQKANIGEYLTDCVRSITRENPKLRGAIDIVDFNATIAGQRIIGDESLKALIGVLNAHRLGLKDVESDIIRRAYEYLLRKFTEGSGQSAGEFYTPREVAVLMSYI
jgi:type I restriction enzyme M protein